MTRSDRTPRGSLPSGPSTAAEGRGQHWGAASCCGYRPGRLQAASTRRAQRHALMGRASHRPHGGRLDGHLTPGGEGEELPIGLGTRCVSSRSGSKWVELGQNSALPADDAASHCPLSGWSVQETDLRRKNQPPSYEDAE